MILKYDANTGVWRDSRGRYAICQSGLRDLGYIQFPPDSMHADFNLRETDVPGALAVWIERLESTWWWGIDVDTAKSFYRTFYTPVTQYLNMFFPDFPIRKPQQMFLTITPIP